MFKILCFLVTYLFIYFFGGWNPMSLGQYWYPTGPFWRLYELSLESSPKCAWQIVKGSLHANFMTLNNLKPFATIDYPCFVIVPIFFCCCCILAAKLCPTLWKPMDCSFQGSCVFYYQLELAQIHVQWVSDAKYLILCYLLLLCPQSSPASGCFPMSQPFASGGQIIGASLSILVKNIQGWFALGLTDLILFLSKGLPRVFSKTTNLKHQIFGAQPSLQSNSHIHTWILEKW